MAEEPQFHIRLRHGDVGRYVLLPGDPGRVPLIARHLDEARELAHNREYVTYTGTLGGTAVSVTSTGIGAPSTAIAIEELAAIGADTFIRVGTAGSIGKDVRSGELVVATAAVRDEGTSGHYLPYCFPAVASHDVFTALISAARRLGQPYRCGIIRSTDAFYADVAPETIPHHDYPLHLWEHAGVLASEMEAAALFVVAALRKVRAGAIVAVVNATEAGPVATDQVASLSLEPLIKTAIEGVRQLIQADSRGDAA
jgi:uridine phosphorylase